MNRRRFLGSLASGPLAAAALTESSFGQQPLLPPAPTDHSWWERQPISVVDWPLLIGTERQLFVDDHLIAETRQVEKQFHQPRKHGEYVLKPEHPWEGTACLAHGTVVREPGGSLRMYYVGAMWHVPFKRATDNPLNNLCVAYSNDGIHWEKPRLGLYPYQGRKDTNLILPVQPEVTCYEQFCVLHDLHGADPGRRWKMGVFHMGYSVFLNDPSDPSVLRISPGPYPGQAYYAYFSEDGLRWKLLPDPIFTSGWDPMRLQTWPLAGVCENTSIMYDQARKKYVAFVRIYDTRPGRPRNWRARGICESDDFLHWTTPRVLFLPREDDEPGLQFYSSTGFPYESMYLGLLRCYRSRSTGQIYFQLVSSRDGMHWERAAFRQPFIDNGPVGSIDGGYHSDFSNPPLQMGNELWLYYGSSTTGKSMAPRVGGFAWRGLD